MEDEARQFQALTDRLNSDAPTNQSPPNIIFCKDIDTAKRLYEHLREHNYEPRLQLYTGIGQEEAIVQKAAQPGTITVTTSALGRNTDILYDKSSGLIIWQTFIDSERGKQQKSGRTGRQGSPGEVHFILNQCDIGNHELENIPGLLDKKGSSERKTNEALYDLLGFLIEIIDNLEPSLFSDGKERFFTNYWGAFSTEIEAHFRAKQQSNHYNKDRFFQETLQAFNQMLQRAGVHYTLSEQQYTDSAYPERSTSPVFYRHVSLSECTPPVDIAYHLLSFEADANLDEALLKQQLAQLFRNIEKKGVLENHQTYLKFLSSAPKTQQAVIQVHQSFLTDYLNAQTQPLNIIQRWFGFGKKLHKIANNEGYLLMFQAFSNLRATNDSTPLLELDVLKRVIQKLIDEYLDSAWFINSTPKTWARALKIKIENAHSLDDIITHLSNSQQDTAREDIQHNQTAFKPIHWSGHSRYQATLGHALDLATALSGNNKFLNSLNGLQKELVQLTSSISKDTPLPQYPTIDALKKLQQSKKTSTDPANRAVLMSSLERLGRIKNRQGPIGMTGRQKPQFFNPGQENDNQSHKPNPAQGPKSR